MEQTEIRKATIADIETIHKMLLTGATDGLLLSRSLSQLYNHVRDFYVYCENGKILGCSSMSVIWEDLAEVRSLFLDERLRGKGIGRKLVEIGIDEVKTLGLRRFFTLTYNTGFFKSLGFKEVPKESLPQKIWADCINCSKFPNCDEIAMLKE